MEYDQFKIGFDSLELGEHNYKFLVDNKFFQSLDYSEINEGLVTVSAVFVKSERLMQMDLTFEGFVNIPCDRCGDDYQQTIDFDESLLIKLGDEDDVDDGILILERGAVEFDISHYLYESTVLSLPSRCIHPDVNGESGCDDEVLNKYLNKKENKDENDIDPRWAALKKLK